MHHLFAQLVPTSFPATGLLPATERASSSEERFRQIVEQSPMAIAVFRSRDMVIEVANERIFEVWDKTNSIIGKRLLEALPELADQPFIPMLQKVYDTGEPIRGNAICALLRRYGKIEEVYFDFTYTALRQGEEESVSGVMVIAIEVTEQVTARRLLEKAQYDVQLELEHQVQERTEELDASNEELLASNMALLETNAALSLLNSALLQSNEDLQQFAHVASHDLKEPLRKIRVFLHKIEEDRQSRWSLPATEYMAKVHTATARMHSMIEGVLAYSAIKAGLEPIERVNLGEVFVQIRIDLEVLIAEKKAIVQVGELPVIEGVGVLLYQLCYNLLVNALKFSRTDIIPVISVRSHLVEIAEVTNVRLEVSDNGIGFDPADAATIFQTFIRLHAKDEYEGTGLGLSLCKTIALRHQGSISATGWPGHGATFILTIPLEQHRRQL
jgi:signal transduction histidine kinase